MKHLAVVGEPDPWLVYMHLDARAVVKSPN